MIFRKKQTNNRHRKRKYQITKKNQFAVVKGQLQFTAWKHGLSLKMMRNGHRDSGCDYIVE